MKKVKHPIANLDLKQDDFLENIAEENREYHKLLFSYGNVVYLYHNLQEEPTLEDYCEWLEGLEETFREGMAAKGFESCKTVISFTRYVREKRDIGMDKFVEKTMGEEQYAKYKELLDTN